MSVWLVAPVMAQTSCDSHAGRLGDLHTREQLKAFVHCAAEHVKAVGWEQAALDGGNFSIGAGLYESQLQGVSD